MCAQLRLLQDHLDYHVRHSLLPLKVISFNKNHYKGWSIGMRKDLYTVKLEKQEDNSKLMQALRAFPL